MTTIDIATRFPRTSLRDALERARKSERWVFPDLVCSSITLLYGRSNVAKSYLVCGMLLSLMIEGRDFLGLQPTDPGKEWRPAVLATDPGADGEYAERIDAGSPEGVDLEVPTYFIGMTKRADEWEALTDHLIAEGYNFVVLDNLMGASGDTNNTEACTVVFDGLNRLVSKGIPVVVLHHETEHRGKTEIGAPPMGSSVVVQKPRVWAQVRKTNRKALRGGNVGIYVQGNKLDQPYDLIVKPADTGLAPVFSVVGRSVFDAETGEPATKKQNRDKGTMDRRSDEADWIVEHCQGLSQRDAAKAATDADAFGREVNDRYIGRYLVGSVLTRKAGPNGTVWARM